MPRLWAADRQKLLDSRFSGNRPTSSYGLTSFFVSSADQPGLEERFRLFCEMIANLLDGKKTQNEMPVFGLCC